MKYNIAENALVCANTTEGNVSITTSGIVNMLNYSEFPVVTLSGNNTLILDCDLGCRVDVHSISYSFRCNTSISNTASGIQFYYRDESFGNYTLLNTCFSGTEYFYPNTAGSLFAPRYIRVKTTMTSISGTTVTGTVHGFEILNNDVVVNFGTDGLQTEENFSLTRDGAADIKIVPIYNSGTVTSDAIVNIEPSFNNLDYVVSISDNSDGPWTYSLDENLVITDSSIFSEGVFTNTSSVDGALQVTGVLDKDGNYASAYTSSTYTTKVFEKEDAEYMMFVLNKNISSLGGKIAVDGVDTVDTVEIRHSDYKPATYSIYRTLYTYYPGTGTTKYAAFKDYWRSTDLLKQTSTYYFFSFSYYRDVMDYYVTIDPETERWAGFVYTGGSSGGTNSEWRLFNNVKESSSVTKLLSTHSATNSAMTFKWSEVILDSTGGVWVYFWATSYRVTDFVDSTGYYLAYFDNTLTEKFKYSNSSNFVQDVSTDYNEGMLWYTNPNSNVVSKVSRDGVIILNYGEDEYTDALGGITALSDGSAWYFNDGSLHRIRKAVGGSTSAVIFLDTIENVSISSLSKLAKDGDGSEALWFIEEFSVGRIFLTGDKRGQVDFKVTLDTPVRLRPVTEGCWVWCASTETTGSTHIIFVSKANKRIENDVNVTYASTPGVLEYDYTNKNYAGKMPLSIDDNWKTLAWNKINVNTYTLPESNYQQLKITFRTQTPAERYSWLSEGTQFIKDDYFTQASGVPVNTQLWSDWTTTRNIVNVQSNRLVLPRSTDPLASNAYIRTKDRMIIGSNPSGVWDVRIKFMFGAGSITGLPENIYLYAYAIDTNNYGDYMCASIEVGVATNNAYLRIYQNSDVTQLTASYNTTIGWQGILRLYKDNSNNIYAQYDRAYDGTFELSTTRPSASNFGTYFYIYITSSKAGSDTYIDDFQVVSGNVYYYTETPGLKSIYTLKPVIINDIYPNSSKELYVRNQVPPNIDVINQYETNLNVKWRIPVN